MNCRGSQTSKQVLIFGGMLLAGASFDTSAPAQDLRIGFIAPRTGIFAQLGTDMFNGFQMYLDEHKGELGGAKVTVILEDDQGRPDTGVTKANKLILQDKVHMLVGGVLATTGYALAPVATRQKMLYIGSIATADDLGQRDFDKYPYMVRPTFVPSQPSHPLGQWACEQGYKRIAAIAADYAFGHETLGGFQKAFEDCGGQDRAEDLAAHRHQGLRAVYPDVQERHRRHLHADGGADVAAIPQAAAWRRKQEADPRRRHQLRRIHPALHGRRGDRRCLARSCTARRSIRRRMRSS